MLELSADTWVELSRSGARHGMGLFETLRVQDGEPRWLALHLERMASGCAFLGMEPPPETEAVAAFIRARTRCASPERGVLRLIAVDDALRVFAGTSPSSGVKPVRLGRSLETTRFSGNPLNRFKTLSYLENLCLSAEAEARGCFDLIAPNERGQLSDGGRTSLFAIIGGNVYTPPVADGALPGIARRLLLEAGLAAEATLCWGDLEKAESVFLANALRGVVPVDRLEGGASLDASHPAAMRAAALLT